MTIAFTGTVRRFNEDKPGGLAVIDIPADLVTQLGGRRQMRVTGTLNDTPFTGSTMLVARRRAVRQRGRSQPQGRRGRARRLRGTVDRTHRRTRELARQRPDRVTGPAARRHVQRGPDRADARRRQVADPAIEVGGHPRR